MSEVLNSLNVPSEAPAKSWAQEVADAGATEPTSAAPEPASFDPAPTEPEPEEAAPEAPEPQETADRRVPLKALQEERQKRAEYERQVQDYQRQLQEYQSWAAEMQRQQQMQMMGHNGGPPMDQPAPDPDPETDPIGALKAAREQQRQLHEMVRQQQEAAQQQAYVQQLNQVAYQAATEAQQRLPDYQDAYRYALQSRAQELAALGTPEHQIGQILQREELSLIDTAVRNRRNPADAIYHFAKARGFQGKAPATQPAQSIDPALQQQKAAVAPSASSAGPPASRGQMSPADIANLRGAAFDKAWQKIEQMAGKKSSIFRD